MIGAPAAMFAVRAVSITIAESLADITLTNVVPPSTDTLSLAINLVAAACPVAFILMTVVLSTR